MRFQCLNNGKLFVSIKNKANVTVASNSTVGTTTFVSGVPKDFMFSWDGTADANSCKWSVDGVEFETFSPTGVNDLNVDAPRLNSIISGWNGSNQVSNVDLNNLEIWDNAENHVFSRSDFDSSPAFDANNSTDPGDTNVLSGQSYIINGVSKTGTLDSIELVTDLLPASLAGGTLTGVLE